jgi:hypothetical protein
VAGVFFFFGSSIHRGHDPLPPESFWIERNYFLKTCSIHPLKSDDYLSLYLEQSWPDQVGVGRCGALSVYSPSALISAGPSLQIELDGKCASARTGKDVTTFKTTFFFQLWLSI